MVKSWSRFARRRPRWLLAVCLLAACVGFGWLMMRSPTAGRWNVVIVTFDTTRSDRIGCYGNERARTPALDALAREGVAYLRCYTPAPVTLPAHCSLMTGLTPLRHGVHDNGPDALASQAETLAEILGSHGYATAGFVGAFVLDGQFGLAQGFQHYDDDMSGGRQADQFCYAERHARLVTDRALEWLSGRAAQPAFVWIHYFDPHHPYDAPGFDPTFSSLTGYDVEISFADSQLKRVVEYFDAQDQPTLFVVAADHGEGLGDHGEPTHGMFTYNTTLKVPLVIRFPGSTHKGARIDAPVSLVDIVPSVLQWLNLPPAADVDGRPLPLTNDAPASGDGGPRGIYFENYFVWNNYGWSPLVGAIWDDLKFIQAPRNELYNLAQDSAETASRFAEADPTATAIERRFQSFLADLRARGSFAGQSVELATSDLARLESLGYIGAREGRTRMPRETEAAADPKDMVGVLGQIHAATTAMEQKRTREAVDVLIQVVSHDDPGNPRAVKLLAALVADAAEERPRVIACLQQARRLGHREMDVDSLALLGVGLLAERQYQASVETLQQVVQRAPLHAAGYRYLGDAHRQLHQFKEAAHNYQRAIELAPRGGAPDWVEHVRQQRDAMSKELERPKPQK